MPDQDSQPAPLKLGKKEFQRANDPDEAPALSAKDLVQSAAAAPNVADGRVLSPLEQAAAAEAAKKNRGNLVLGGVAGLVAALVGAAVWAGIGYATETEIGWLAWGIGLLVGFAVRVAGGGNSQPFSITAAVLALGGVVAGKVALIYTLVMKKMELDLAGASAVIDEVGLWTLYQEVSSPIDLLFYGLAVATAFQVAKN